MMGYEAHITRASKWTASAAQPISLEEWQQYIAKDDEMRLDGFAETPITSKKTLRCESEGLAAWAAYSKAGEDGNEAWFDYRDGRIVVKNPDDEMIAKMVRVAQALAARVVGDDGEAYPAATSSAVSHTSWWRRLLP